MNNSAGWAALKGCSAVEYAHNPLTCGSYEAAMKPGWAM